MAKTGVEINALYQSQTGATVRQKIKELNDYKYKEQKKMTRDEAISTIGRFYSGPQAGAFVKALEALGLIKFEEPKSDQDRLNDVIKQYPSCDGVTGHTVKWWLDKAGLKIVEK